jgi:NADPH:quinone reductase-like Zn-dependent oxidoreductase
MNNLQRAAMYKRPALKTERYRRRLQELAGLLLIGLSVLNTAAAQIDSTDDSLASENGYRQVVMTAFGGPEVLQVIRQTTLPRPGPGEVRVRVLAAGVSYTDTMVRRGIYPGIDAELPYAPGYDLVGIVDAVGEGVTGVTVGQRVADLSVWGAYSDYVIRDDDGLVPVPAGVDSAEAVSLVLSYMTAYQMLHRVAEVRAGQKILIHGASGGVGTALAQLGGIAGLRMFGTASTRNQEYVAALGVTPIDYRTEDFVVRVMEATDGEGVDAVFDAIGLENFKRSYRTLKAGGVLVPYGFYSASDTGAEFGQYVSQRAEWNAIPNGARAAAFYSISRLRKERLDWFKEDLAALFDLLASGTLTPKVSGVFPLEEAATAHELFDDKKVRGKLVLRLAEDTVQ